MLAAAIYSILAGASIVLSRNVNALLAKATGNIPSTVWNYITGLTCSALCFGVVAATGGFAGLPAALPAPWAFTGGMIGMAVVMLLNVCVKKISAFYMTLFMFIGQVFTGVALDIVLSGQFSLGNLLGGAAVTVGLALNLRVDRQGQKAEEKGR